MPSMPPVSRPAVPSQDLLPRDEPTTGLARFSTQDLRIDPDCYGQGTSEPSPPFQRRSPEGPGTGPAVRHFNTNVWDSSPAGLSVCEGSGSLSGSTTVSTTARSTAAAVATIEVHMPPAVRHSPLLVSCRDCSGEPEQLLMPPRVAVVFPTAASVGAKTSHHFGDPLPHPSPRLQSPPLPPRASAAWVSFPVQPRSPQSTPRSPQSPVQPRAPQSSPQSSPPAARSPQSSPHSSHGLVPPPGPITSPARGQSPDAGGSCAAACAACAAGEGEDSHAPLRTRAAADAQDWDAQQVAAFVRSLGAPLCQHADAFLANGVTGARLRVLRADELPQIGVRRFEDILALLSHIRARLELPPPPPREPMRRAAANALHEPPPPPPPPTPPPPEPLSLPPRKARFDEQRYRELHEQIAREADLLSRSPPKMSLHQLKAIQPMLLQGGGALGSQTVAYLLQRLRCENSTTE